MNYARLEQSPRLQTIYAALKTGPKTTRDLIIETGYCAINSAIAEMRAQGINITCKMVGRTKGSSIYLYTMEREAA